MLIVSVNLKSAIDSSQNGELFRVEIVNDGTGSPDVGNYIGRIYKENDLKTQIPIRAFCRKQYNALYLLSKVLCKLFEESKWKNL